MATGTDVLTAIALDDTYKTETAPNLATVNFAIDTSWPMWRLTEYAAGGTFATSTYTYSLSTLTTIEREVGIANVYVIPTGDPPIDISPRCRQYYDHSATAWTLQVANDISSKYNGYPFYVEYQYRHPRLTVISGTVYAPIGVMAQVAFLWFAMYGATSQNTGNELWKAFGPEYLRGAKVLWSDNKSQQLPINVTHGRGRM